jgi:transposase-like protein
MKPVYSDIDGIAAWASMLALAERARARFNALPIAEQERIRKERADREERNRVEWFVRQGKCPYCESKLIRGKKDKNNDYKRVWHCPTCDINLSL